MIEQIKDSWQAFKDSKPGHRFRDRYERRQRAEHGRWSMGAVLRVLLGAAIVVGGLFLLVAPGPGALVTLFGLGLLGSEFAPVARALDWAELKARALARRAKGFWDAAPLVLKALIVLLGLAGVAGAGYLAYRLLLAG